MKTLVVSGFLGAGKTTFIEKMVDSIGINSVILENEYGEVGIDGDLLKKGSKNIWEMTEGCICCSMESNFANSVMTISNSVDPDLLIVEPTGVGLLSSVIGNIKKVEYDRIKILEPITIVDPSCIDSYKDEFGDIFEDQIKSSRLIILSKVENLSEEEINISKQKIKYINDKAQIVDKDYRKFEKEWFENLLNRELLRDIEKNEAEIVSNIENIGFTNVEFDDIGVFESYMSAIMRGSFGKVVRAKGFLPIGGVWAKFDIVDKKYTIIQIDPMSESKLIIIGSKIDRKRLNILFGKK